MIARRTGATAAALGLLLSFGFIGRAAGAAENQKTPRADAPALNTRFRDKLATQKKERGAAKAQAKTPRLQTDATRPERERAFAARAESGAAKAERPSKGTAAVVARGDRKVTAAPATNKTQGAPFNGRHGTGLGDIFEDEPNDTTAQTLDDLPVNVVGYINPDNDVDYYSFTAQQGESIRIEVIADRIFGSPLDSYLEVLADDGTTVLASNDDFFDNSNDSFIRFVAPDAGDALYFVGVSDFGGIGGANFGYVLNITVADAPDLSEQEVNDTTGNADILTLPSLVFGTSDEANDYDVYTFQANGNQTLVVDVDADVFASDMDPVVELYDDRGGFLFGVDDTDGIDPRFNIVLPYSGTYYLQVYDRDLLGGSTYYYSMNVSLQSAVGSPSVSSFKVLVGGSTGQLLKQVRGSGYTSSNGGSAAEIDGVEVGSRPAPAKPTSRIKVAPAQPVDRGQSVTVVNPDGRRSNPGIVS